MGEAHQQERSADRFEELLKSVCEEIATETEFLELQDILRDDPRALEKYVRRLRLCADLYSVAEEGTLYEQYLDRSSLHVETISGGCQQLPAKKFARRRRRFAGRWVHLLLAASLSALLLLVPWMRNRLSGGGANTEPSALNMSPSPMPAVAYMTSTNGCDWSGAAPWLRAVGNRVQVGDEIALNEGIAEFRLENGVYLSIEGPAGLVLTSPNSLVLQYGKATVQVPWPNREYRILAGACRIETGDAEFGVWLTGGRTDIHVFSGEVLASNVLMSVPNDDQLDGDPSGELVASRREFTQGVVSQGRAIAVDNRRNVMRVTHSGEADHTLFATKLSMAGPLPVSNAYVDRILADGPMGYWRFESVDNGIISNEIPGGTELSTFGDVRLTALAGNRVVELPPGVDSYLFSRTPMNVLANSDYSFEAWVKPSHVHYGTILGLCRSEPITAYGNAFLLEAQGSHPLPGRPDFGHPNSIRFLHRDPPQRSALVGTNCFSEDPYTVRRWQHVVAIKRGPQMELYVDGNLEGEAMDTSTLAAGQRLVIGRQARSVDKRLQFIGQLDEVAVYARALTLEEIRAHYKMIDWTQAKKLIFDRKKS